MTSKKSNKKQIWMSVVALLLIALSASGIAYSWIEGGTTYTMETEDKKGITIKAPQNYQGTLNLQPGTGKALDIIKYDVDTTNYSDLIFSPMSSEDGENFLIPDAFDASGNAVRYRSTTTNDVGKSYIDFSFEYDVPTNEVYYVALKSEPTITATKSGAAVSDVSPFRILLSNGKKSYIFAGDGTANTANVVTSTGGDTVDFTTAETDGYILNSTTTKNRLFSYKDGYEGNIHVAVWLESGANRDALDDLRGCDVSISFELAVEIPKYLIGYNAATEDSSGTELAAGFTGGSIQFNGTNKTSKGMDKITEGSTLVLKAVPKTNYEFEGWYVVTNGTESARKSTSATWNVKPEEDIYNLNYINSARNNNTYYLAKFKEKPKYTINVVASPTEGGTVSVGATNTATTKTYTGYKDSTAIAKAVASGTYKFVGWYDNADGTGTPISEEAEYSFSITANKTLYAKFIPSKTTTIYIEKRSSFTEANGYHLWIYNDSDKTMYSENVWPGSKASLDPAGSGYYVYKFDTPDVGNFRAIISNHGSHQYPKDDGNANTNDGLLGEIGNTYVFTADNHLEQIGAGDMFTLHVAATPSAGGTAKVSGVTSFVENSDKVMIRNGDEVKLSATPSGSYTFIGWYKDAACTQLITSEANDTVPVTKAANDDQEPTYYAKFGTVSSYTAKAIAVTDSTSSSSTGGTVQVDSATDGATSSKSVTSGTTVTFKATAKSGYTFKGWYESATSTTVYNANTSFSEAISGNKTYYAKFEKNTTITVYFTNNYGWSGTINCHYWGGSTSTNWPGVAMTYVKQNEYNQKVYKVTIPADSTGIIFNSNGSPQTVDITTNIADGKGFYISGQDGSKYKVSSYDYS